MTTTGGAQLEDLPEPAALHRRLARHHPLNWGDPVPTKAELLSAHGQEPVRRALETLCARVVDEPAITAEFVSALPDGSTTYKLESRVKSPLSLARKYADLLETLDDDEPDDVLRYTMLSDSPQQLVSQTSQTVDRLRAAGWRPVAAMHSYTEGSRYKGIHVGFQRQSGETVEVQFHSAASVSVKEATTAPYEIERSAEANPADRAAARALCIQLSNSLSPPPGIASLRTLGGVPVEVNTFGDSRRSDPPAPAKISTDRLNSNHQAHRSQGRQVDGTGR
ncbi:hypothetical protein [Kribbella sp. CA-293567]|uniref:hypothetical protein n=1 Tax=Kribbella sp. CA-293567 TaxID=3002436 RepID=UPI0022DDA561|nr:hypothetical protein [Kribbella sp. CA-293567]WBQ07137.1 hypothetical protein OX958_10125 [Kribbella sp. CA-293567]